MAECDCYVTLRRSERFGLTMAGAMAKPVIATNYSGNVDFMHSGNSHLITYKLIPIPKGCVPAQPAWSVPTLTSTLRCVMCTMILQAPASSARGRATTFWSVSQWTGRQPFLQEQLASQVPRPAREGSGGVSRADESLATASRRFAEGPGGLFVRAKRRRPGVRTVRAALRRLLSPYLLDQHELQTAIVDAIGQLRHEVAQLRHEVDAVERLEAELTATPYMADAGTVDTTDETGRPVS